MVNDLSIFKIVFIIEIVLKQSIKISENFCTIQGEFIFMKGSVFKAYYAIVFGYTSIQVNRDGEFNSLMVEISRCLCFLAVFVTSHYCSPLLFIKTPKYVLQCVVIIFISYLNKYFKNKKLLCCFTVYPKENEIYNGKRPL